MDNKQRNELAQIIAKKMEISRRKIEQYKEMAAPVSPDESIGRVTRMDAINNKSVVEAALREEETRFQGLLYMENNVEKENFGQCILCSQPIPIPRLLFMPHSPYCVNCAK